MTVTHENSTILETAPRGEREPAPVGEILRPHDAGYDAARRVWNGAIDRRPAMIARCRTSTEVAAAVRLAADTGLEIAVRGGGHSIPGHSVCEGGIMIDLSPMKRVDVDVERGIAVAQPGVLWQEYDAATQARGVASPGGEISHTGVAGLTLGGGIGWLSRRHGLACDNLVGAEVVLADGSVVDVDDESDPDLMWGLRGGGGNFGIVTAFRFRVHDVPPLLAGMLAWPADRAGEILSVFFDIAADAPRDLSPAASLVVAPPAPFVPAELHFQPVVAVSLLWTGDPTTPPDTFERFRALEPVIDTTAVHDYVDIQRWYDDGVPHGRRYHVRSEWLGELDGGASEALIDSAAAMSSPFDQILIRRLGGAIADVPADATAFRFRDADYLLTVAAGWDDGADDPHVAWCRGTWSALHPWSCGGSYVNHLAADEGRERVREAYGQQTWDRLVTLKRRVDPHNRFHLNHNIEPS